MTDITHRTFSLDYEVVKAFEAAVPRGERSKFINEAMAAAVGIRTDNAGELNIPKEKLLAATVADLTSKLEAAKKRIKELEKIKGDDEWCHIKRHK